jgi:hypothetical protein
MSKIKELIATFLALAGIGLVIAAVIFFFGLAFGLVIWAVKLFF